MWQHDYVEAVNPVKLTQQLRQHFETPSRHTFITQDIPLMGEDRAVDKT
jgi:hypothetical protein